MTMTDDHHCEEEGEDDNDGSSTSSSLRQRRHASSLLSSSSHANVVCTPENVRDLIDALRTPLFGRSVLIPLGHQAFRRGVLTPVGVSITTPKSTTDSPVVPVDGRSETDEEEEFVTMKNNDGVDQIFTRQQAKAILQKEYDTLTKSRRATGTTTSSASAMVAKSSSPRSRTISPSPSINRKDQTSSTNTTHQPLIGRGKEISSSCIHVDECKVFEIREEVDASGAEVASRVVHFSQQLGMLEQILDKKDLVGNGDDHVDDDPSIKSVEELVAASAATPLIQSRPALSDTMYEKLSRRLDELIKLEEEKNLEFVTSQMSQQTLQGLGWKKGFFHNSQVLKSKPSPAKMKAIDTSHESWTGKTPMECSSERPLSPTLPSEPHFTKTSTNSAEDEINDSISNASRRVVFGEVDEVMEIPRAGDQQRRSKFISLPISPSLSEVSSFSSGVRERSSKNRITRPSLSTTPSRTHTLKSNNSLSFQQPKRMSRFALQQKAERDQW